MVDRLDGIYARSICPRRSPALRANPVLPWRHFTLAPPAQP